MLVTAAFAVGIASTLVAVICFTTDEEIESVKGFRRVLVVGVEDG
jgi:hypothetical protein